MTDALVVLGAYRYFASYLPWYLRTLNALFVLPADRRRGLQELEAAAAQARFASTEASLALAAAYSWENDPERALGLIEALQRVFPDNVCFTALQQRILLRAHRPAEALVLATNTLRRLEADQRVYISGWLADQQYELGLIQLAQTNYAAALTAFGLAQTLGAHKPWMQDWSLLRQGTMYDLQGLRVPARRCYQAVEAAPHDSALVRHYATRFLQTPYAGEELE